MKAINVISSMVILKIYLLLLAFVFIYMYDTGRAEANAELILALFEASILVGIAEMIIIIISSVQDLLNYRSNKK